MRTVQSEGNLQAAIHNLLVSYSLIPRPLLIFGRQKRKKKCFSLVKTVGNLHSTTCIAGELYTDIVQFLWLRYNVLFSQKHDSRLARKSVVVRVKVSDKHYQFPPSVVILLSTSWYRSA